MAPLIFATNIFARLPLGWRTGAAIATARTEPSRGRVPLTLPDIAETELNPEAPMARWHPVFNRNPGWQFSVMLVLEVVLLFIAIPTLSTGEAGQSAVAFLQLVIAGVAIALLAASGWLRLALAGSFGLTLLARFLPGLLPQTITLATIFIYNILVTAAMAWAVFGAGTVNHHRIAGAVFIYLNIALLFGLADSALILVVPDAFSGLADGGVGRASKVIHFSFATLTAEGDGGVMPVSPFARSLADLETIIGQLFPAILLSRLVGLHLARST
jgi:hypothetical protein